MVNYMEITCLKKEHECTTNATPHSVPLGQRIIINYMLNKEDDYMLKDITH